MEESVESGKEEESEEWCPWSAEDLKWTCERLFEVLEQEEERRKGLETKAVLAATAVLAIGAYCLKDRLASMEPIPVWSAAAAAAAVVLLSTFVRILVLARPDLFTQGTFTLVAVVAILWFADGSPRLDLMSLQAFLMLAGAVLAVFSVLHTWMAIRVSLSSDLDVRQLADQKVFVCRAKNSFEVLAEHLRDVVEDLSPQLDQKADMSQLSQAYALGGAAFFLLGLGTSMLA